MKQIYLAGRCESLKWKLVESIKSVNFVATDVNDGNHGMNEHDLAPDYAPDFHGWTTTKYLGGEVKGLIRESDELYAVLDGPGAHGTIAELVFAYAIAKPCSVFMTKEVERSRICFDQYRLGVAMSYGSIISGSEEELRSCIRKFSATESPIEDRFLRATLGHDLFHRMEPQYWIGKYRADFAMPTERIVVELDGHEYHSSRDARTRDAERDRSLAAAGWLVVRFTGTEVHKNARKCVESLQAVVTGRTVPLEGAV